MQVSRNCGCFGIGDLLARIGILFRVGGSED